MRSRMNLRSLCLLSSLVALAAVGSLGACSSETETADAGADGSTTPTATATSTGTTDTDAAPIEAGAGGATLSALQASIFTPSCAKARCHMGSRPSAGLNLEAGSSFAELVGVASEVNAGQTRVVAGDPANSLLVRALKGTVGNVERMPDGASALSAAQIANVEAWIAAGAKND